MTFFFGNSSGDLMADRRYDLALQLSEDKDYDAAADLLRQGLEIAPNWPPLHFHLGEACRMAGYKSDAQAAFQNYLALDPEDKMGAAIKLSLMGATAAPATMPAAYVQSLFDQYAPKFEKSLIEKLQYNTPEIIYRAVSDAGEREFEHLLDLGCGTGLAAQLFAGSAARMTGVDLSPAMVEIARAKNIYHDLYVGDIDAFLQKNKDSYDLVLSADVFVYIGALEQIFQNIAARISPEGLFAFSVQSLKEGRWALGADHRYAHARAYIEAVVKEAEFQILSCESVILRLDGADKIDGMVFVCRKI